MSSIIPGDIFTILPKWRQYTIDERLGEFRKVVWRSGIPSIEYIPFASKKGMKIRYRMDLENENKMMKREMEQELRQERKKLRKVV